MSKYIESIENDYNNGKITLDEITKLREDYNKLSAYDKGNLDIKYGKKKSNSKTNNPKNIIPSRFVDYSDERNAFWASKYPTSRTLFKIFEVLNIIIVILFVIAILYSISDGGGFGAILAVLPLGFAIILFLLGKELLLFQVDKNYFEYKQAEKYLK